MSTAYISTRYPPGFKPSDYLTAVQNGSQALATTVYTIADNQQWLATEDLDLAHFHQSWATGEWNNSARTIRMLIPPFCQFAGFHFYVARNFDMASAASPVGNGLYVTSGVDQRAVHLVPFGEDITASGKATFSNASYGWVHIDGIVQNPQTDDQSALKLVSSTSETWTSVEVSITMGTKVYCRAAAYHIIPNRTGYIVTV